MGLHEAVGDPIQDKAKLKGILTNYFLVVQWLRIYLPEHLMTYIKARSSMTHSPRLLEIF